MIDTSLTYSSGAWPAERAAQALRRAVFPAVARDAAQLLVRQLGQPWNVGRAVHPPEGITRLIAWCYNHDRDAAWDLLASLAEEVHARDELASLPEPVTVHELLTGLRHQLIAVLRYEPAAADEVVTVARTHLAGRLPDGVLIGEPTVEPQDGDLHAELRRWIDDETALVVDSRDLDIWPTYEELDDDMEWLPVLWAWLAETAAGPGTYSLVCVDRSPRGAGRDPWLAVTEWPDPE